MDTKIAPLLPSTMMQGFIGFLRFKGYVVSAQDAEKALAAMNAFSQPATYPLARSVARSVFAYDLASWEDFDALWDQYWLAKDEEDPDSPYTEAKEWGQVDCDLSQEEVALLKTRIEEAKRKKKKQINKQEASSSSVALEPNNEEVSEENGDSTAGVAKNMPAEAKHSEKMLNEVSDSLKSSKHPEAGSVQEENETEPGSDNGQSEPFASFSKNLPEKNADGMQSNQDEKDAHDSKRRSSISVVQSEDERQQDKEEGREGRFAKDAPLKLSDNNAQNYELLAELASAKAGDESSQSDSSFGLLGMLTRVTLAVDKMTADKRDNEYDGELLNEEFGGKILKRRPREPEEIAASGGDQGRGSYGNRIDNLDSERDCRIVRNLARQIALGLRFSSQRRYKACHRGRNISFRNTMRKSLATGGEAYELGYRKRNQGRPRITTVLDVSGSMQNYYKFLLYFTQGLTAGGLRPESFIFNTELLRVTDLMRKKDLARAAEQMQLGGGTLIVDSLNQLISSHRDQSLGNRVTLFIISDGESHDHSKYLSQSLKKLKANTRRLIWLTPDDCDRSCHYIVDQVKKEVDFIGPIARIKDLKDLVTKLKGS